MASKIQKESESKDPKMTPLNQVLRLPGVWETVRAELDLGPECADIELPDFVDDLVYGVMSEKVHNPGLISVIVSDKSLVNYQDFFRCMARIYALQYKDFDEELTESVPFEDQI